MDKSLKVREDEWRERGRGEQNFEIEKGEWGLNFELQFLKINVEKMHTQGFYL